MREVFSLSLTSFERTTDDIITADEFRELLKRKPKVRIKYGVDVTAPFLHIGHAVNLWMMRELQELGHKVIFLIGDFTTLIGDPTGKLRTRPIIPEQEIEANAREFIKQVSLILLTDPQVFEIRRNSEWYGRMPVSEFISLLSMVTHSRVMARDMFERRLKTGEEVYLHEIIYPILQGYDSVMIQSDLTIVGTDQLFNEMMGRFYQEKFGQQPQVIITTKITPGIDGKEKQSKSLGNYIALLDTPRDKFGKIMSIPDHLIVPYLEVYTKVPISDVQEISAKLEHKVINPMDAKLILARAVVERYHGSEIGKHEYEWFVKTFSQRKVPDDIPTITIPSSEPKILDVLQIALPGTSKTQLRRLCDQKAIRINDNVVEKYDEVVRLESGYLLKVGRRRWFRLEVSHG